MSKVMELEFREMKRSEIRQAAELATRAFDEYEYFTNWFPDQDERNRVQFAVIWREYKTNFGVATYLVARETEYNGKTMGSWSLKKGL